ncbi:MAG: acetamidase/formamidase family protein [Tepidanaerobacteraceae bacterium]
MKVIGKNNAIFYFDVQNKPRASVKLNEEFWVKTNDCYFGQIQSKDDLRPNIDDTLKNAATGPIFVEGVQPGDFICIEILDIQLNSYGVMITSPGHGILGDLITEPDTKIIPIKKNKAIFSDKILLTVEPMIGVIGVSSISRIRSTFPGDHGGNMDVKDIKSGSKVYFTANVEGAGVAVGDLHACMADGEISGSGIEIAGRVKLRVSKVQGFNVNVPIVETEKELMVIASEENLEKAIRKGVILACKLLQEFLDINFPDAYRLVSISCDVKICQVVNPLVTIRVCVPKSLLKFK